MIKPSIHLNGSSAEILLDNYQRAADAVWSAMGLLRDTAPNGRDYYPQGSDALRQAQAEHQARVDVLQKVHNDLQELVFHVAGVRR